MTPRTETCQIPLSIGFPRQEYWCGLLFPFFSRGYSGPRDWNCIPCIGRQILYHWATREAQCKYLSPNLLESKSISIFWTTKSFQVAQVVKNCSTHSGAEGDSVWSSGQEDPLETEPNPVFLPRQFQEAWQATVHGAESDMTEHASEKKKKKDFNFLY